MFYTLGVRLYGSAIKIASLFNPKAKKWVVGRKSIWSKLPDVSSKKVVWFHCASLGEFEQGKPVIQRWKNEYPNDFVLVTFFSPSGYEVKKNDEVADYVCYLPLDTPKNAKRFVNHFKPKNVFFVKYEFWVNYINAIHSTNCKLYAISASFRLKQRFFKWYGGIFRKALRKFDFIFVQRIENIKLLRDIKVDRVVVAGDTRYDRVASRLDAKISNLQIANWSKSDESIFVIGSSWPVDEEIIIPFINDGTIATKVIIAPHEVDENHINEITKRLKVPYQCYTMINDLNPIKTETKVIILDCIGVLAEAYKYGTIAYVGGGFGTGLHNILEPAIFGLPVIFGPEFYKFPEAYDFISAGIGATIRDKNEFIEAYEHFRESENIQEKAINFMKSQIGATDIIIDKIKSTD
ncbi:MAG: glycosyltransferase N-terminal domain-containing protein [Brumimicrobium sp.]